MLDWMSRNVFHPLLDIKDQSIRLKTLKRLMKTQWQTEKQIRCEQWLKTVKIVTYANENCDYYRDLFSKYNINVDNLTNEEFQKIPILTKNNIQEYTDKIISNRFSKDELVTAKTGGSTGKSLQVYFDKRWQEIRVADSIRSDRWAGWDLGIKRAAIWGNPPKPSGLKELLRDKLIDRLIYLDTMKLNENSMGEYVRLWLKHKPKVIFGHSHSIYIFAKYLKDNNINNLRPIGIISTSMMLLPTERELIEDVFSCKVTDRYGCEEVGLVASECELHKGMHLNIEHLYIEFLDDKNKPVAPGEPGKIVVTDLYNYGMPIIRYRIDDVGILGEQKCKCGRDFPIMKKITGRVADFLKHSDGSLIAGVSLVELTLTAIPGIEQMQIVQNDYNKLLVNIVKGAEYTSETEKNIIHEFQKVFGNDVSIEIKYMKNIPQERTGKFRFAICNI